MTRGFGFILAVIFWTTRQSAVEGFVCNIRIPDEWCDKTPNWTLALADCNDVPHIPGAEIVTVQMSVVYQCTTTGLVFDGSALYTEKTCRGNDTGWVGPQPTCRAIDCGPPPLLSDAIAEHNTTSLGGVTKYLCKDGYKLSSDGPHLSCTDDAKWTGEVPSCVRVNCPPLPFPTNGSVSVTEDGTGFIASYTCDTGHQLVGETSRRCQDDTTWSGEEPTCDIVTCPLPATPLNVIVKPSVPFYEFGETIETSCEEGYRMTGGDEFQLCGADGRFSGEMIACAADYCQTPTILPDSVIVNVKPEHYWVNYTITLQCLEGFTRRTGDFEQTCQSDRTWSGEPLFCEPIHCPVPPTINFVAYTLSGLHYGAAVRYDCMDGYEQVRGDMIRTCDAAPGGGAWSGSSPECRRISCSRNDLGGVNVKEHINGLLYEDTVGYVCEDGHTWTSGDMKRACRGNASWSGLKPTCSPVDCQMPPEKTAGAEMLDTIVTFVYGDVARYGCLDGHILSGGGLYIKCEKNGQWNSSLPLCQEAICTVPPHPTNGYVTMVGNNHVIYQCDTGYMLDGDGTRSCDSLAGSWSGRPPECDVISCPPPPSVPNAVIATSPVDQSWKSQVRYQCRGGHTLANGDGRITCGVTGRWEGDLPHCNPVDCGKLSKPARGDVHYSSTTLGSLSVSSCDEGYDVVDGDAFRYCTSVGQWNGSEITCEATVCPPPYVPPHAELNDTRAVYTLGSTVALQCIVGYVYSSGNFSRTCTSEGEWDGQPMECTEIQCEQLYNTIFTEVLHTQRTFGSLAVYSCNSGSEMISGNKFRTCLADGNWSGEAAECEPIGCPEPNPNNAIIVEMAHNYTFGVTISFDCYPGFVPVYGDKLINCTQYGTWDGYPLSCRAIECSLSQPEVGTHIVEYNTRFNKTAVFACDEGYKYSSGMDERRCLENSSWEGEALHCEEIFCPEPLVVPRSRLISSGRSPGDSVTYYCNSGPDDPFYRITQLTCRQDGTWSDDPPECANITCPELGDVANSHRVISGLYPGDTITYTCYDGYSSGGGTSVLICLSDGRWNGSAPTCRRQSCGFPPPVPYAKITGSGVQYGDNVQYECFKDYFLAEGDSNRTCKADGKWSGQAPRCQRIFVPDGPEPTVDPTAPPVDKPKLVGKRYVYPTVEAVRAPEIGSLVLAIVLILIGILFLLDSLTYYKNFCYMKDNLNVWCIPAIRSLCCKCQQPRVMDVEPSTSEANPENGEISERTEPVGSSRRELPRVRNGLALNRGSVSLRGAKNPETLTDDDGSVELTACRYAKRINTTPFTGREKTKAAKSRLSYLEKVKAVYNTQ